jgi:hypothetical protein
VNIDYLIILKRVVPYLASEFVIFGKDQQLEQRRVASAFDLISKNLVFGVQKYPALCGTD